MIQVLKGANTISGKKAAPDKTGAFYYFYVIQKLKGIFIVGRILSNI
jgi:hypothetical protein